MGSREDRGEGGDGDIWGHESGRSVEGDQRRIRLHLTYLLGVVREVVGMSKQNIGHHYPLLSIRLASIGRLLGKFLARDQRTAQNDALGKIGEPEFPGEGVTTRAETPANGRLDDKPHCTA